MRTATVSAHTSPLGAAVLGGHTPGHLPSGPPARATEPPR
jgi:hypothetical protein